MKAEASPFRPLKLTAGPPQLACRGRADLSQTLEESGLPRLAPRVGSGDFGEVLRSGASLANLGKGEAVFVEREESVGLRARPVKHSGKTIDCFFN